MKIYKNYRLVGFRLTPDKKEEFERKAAKAGLSISELGRQLVDDWLKTQSEDGPQEQQ